MPTSGPPSIALHLGDSCSSTSATLIAISPYLEQRLPPPPRRPKTRSTAEVAAATMRASSSSASEDHEGSLSPHHYLPLLRARPTRSFNLVKVVIDMVRSLFPRIHALISSVPVASVARRATSSDAVFGPRESGSRHVLRPQEGPRQLRGAKRVAVGAGPAG
ncbi:hypothetical protein MUK42_22276 [Musa troglodytarum]|uniref:Uncharacterized protein n=1 Tax=Musa troglodytarum TaxID=320322 RepID=A0A9E7EVT7_9LILI|nr:hypothetical protein MUK42_22276 [Musa troglodytarum]